MRAVVQRVRSASVFVDGITHAEISSGLLVLLGISDDDGAREIQYIAEKIIGLRIFPDENGIMNRSVGDLQGEILIVSQFTLYGDTRKGRRPSYNRAASPEVARKTYEDFCSQISAKFPSTQFGVFKAEMQVSLVNDGPVTLLIDSEKQF